MEDTATETLELPASVEAMLDVLGFAHAAVTDDDTWAAAWAKISAAFTEHDPDEEVPDAEALRTRIHAAVDYVGAATQRTMMLAQLSQLLGPAGVTASPEQPAVTGPDDHDDYHGMYI